MRDVQWQNVQSQKRDSIAGHSNIGNANSTDSTATFAALIQDLLCSILQRYCYLRLYSAFGGMNCGRWIGKDLERNVRDKTRMPSLYLPVLIRSSFRISYPDQDSANIQVKILNYHRCINLREMRGWAGFDLRNRALCGGTGNLTSWVLLVATTDRQGPAVWRPRVSRLAAPAPDIPAPTCHRLGESTWCRRRSDHSSVRTERVWPSLDVAKCWSCVGWYVSLSSPVTWQRQRRHLSEFKNLCGLHFTNVKSYSFL